MKVSVVIATRGANHWLNKVLWGYEYQTYNNFDVILANYGAEQNASSLLADFSQLSHLKLRHIFRREGEVSLPVMLNDAIKTSEADYLIFSNDHCVPRNDFVENHMKSARMGCFLTGGSFNLPMDTSEYITREDIATLFAFELRWLYLHGWKPGWIAMQMVNLGLLEKISSSFPSLFARWNLDNASAWKHDLVRINGFNESCSEGELGEDIHTRLAYNRVKGLAVNSRAVCLHLKEERPRRIGETGGADFRDAVKEITLDNRGTTTEPAGVARQEQGIR